MAKTRVSKKVSIPGHMAKIVFEWVFMTPARAQSYLDTLYEMQRTVNKAAVAKYTADMGAGAWEGVLSLFQFDTKGHMIDGQHRCLAIIASGACFWACIAREVPTDSYKLLDSGKGRTAADAFKFDGFENTHMITAAIRWCLAYENNGIGTRGVYAKTGDEHRPSTTPEILKYHKRHPLLHDSVPAARKTKLLPPACSVFLHFKMTLADSRRAEQFWGMLVGEAPAAPTNPVSLLLPLLHKAKYEPTQAQNRMSGPERAYACVIAWRAFCDGSRPRTSKSFRWKCRRIGGSQQVLWAPFPRIEMPQRPGDV